MAYIYKRYFDQVDAMRVTTMSHSMPAIANRMMDSASMAMHSYSGQTLRMCADS